MIISGDNIKIWECDVETREFDISTVCDEDESEFELRLVETLDITPSAPIFLTETLEHDSYF
jgi:hypothetical protein